MKVPRIQGIIDRRILANYRVDPAAIAPLLPPPFRPQRFAGHAIAGICLIRLRQIRPCGVPAFLGLSSENAAHRIAVEWDDGGGSHRGVYIPRRDSTSRLNALAGGRLFPGVHHHASFTVRETRDHLHVSVRSDDGRSSVSIDAAVASRLPSGSVFPDLGAASAFFAAGAVGYSPAGRPDQYDGIELRTREWHVEPLAVERIQSSFFDDRLTFPEGSIAFDCALLMRGIRHEWHGQPPLCVKCEPAMVG